MPKSKIKCICPVCNNIFSASTIKRHVFSDIEKHREFLEEVERRKQEFLQTFIPPECEYCNKEIKYTLNKLENFLIFQILGVEVEKKCFSFLKKWCSFDCSSKSFVSWNKGKTKWDDERLMKISQDRMGENNPMFSILNDENKKKQWLENVHASGIYERLSKENKGKSLEDRFGKDVADKIKETNRQWCITGKPHSGHKHSQETKNLLRVKAIELQVDLGNKISNPHKKLGEALKKIYQDKVELEYNAQYYAIDLAFPEKKLAIEVDGDFWHCNEEKGFYPKYDSQKRNIKNDKQKNTYLTNRGWNVIRVWTSDIEEDIEKVIQKVKDEYERS